MTDVLSHPVRVALSGGQEADGTQAPKLLAGLETEAVIADKGYDSDEVVRQVESQRVAAVISPRSNRKEPREYDQHWHGERYQIECEIGF